MFCTPPPATWVAMFGDSRRPWFDTYLVAWIPDMFVDVVDDAITAETSEDGIAWLENTDTELSVLLFGSRYED